MSFPEVSWLALLPTLIVSGVAILVLLADLWIEGPDREGLGWVGIVGLLAAAVASAVLWGTEEVGFGGAYTLDRYALFFNQIFCLAAALTLLMSMDYLHLTAVRTGEYYALVLFATSGMLMMAAASDLVVLFLGLEVMSVAVYVLAGILRSDLKSNESALKYFLLGAFASGFLLFGIAFLFGATGTTTLAGIAAKLGHLGGEQRALAFLGIGLLIVGFGFKVAAVPFHSWVPDVYEGAPTAITAFMAVGVKAAAFAAFARAFLHTLAPVSVEWTGVLWVLAVLTMTLGNVVAIVQSNIKRMLAYSSIAHAGYLLVGMVAGRAGGGAILYYLFVYALMNIGAFAVVMALGQKGESNERLDDLAGIGFKYPGLGMAMAIFLLSLAGIPALAGFTGKFYLFSAAVESGHVGLALIGVLNSVVSMYYYAGVLVKMYMAGESKLDLALSERPYLATTLVITAFGTVALGLFPSWAFDLARSAFQSLG